MNNVRKIAEIITLIKVLSLRFIFIGLILFLSLPVFAQDLKLPYRDLDNRTVEEFPKEYLVSMDEFNAQFTEDGNLYHGTDKIEKAVSVMSNGFVESTGEAYFGNGVFTSKNFQSVLRYTRPNGIVLELKLNQNPNIRILNFRYLNRSASKPYKNSEHYKETFAEAEAAGMDYNDYLAKKFGIDIILNDDRIILKNVAAIESPEGLLGIAQKYAKGLGNRNINRQDRIERYKMLQRVLDYSPDIGIKESINSKNNFKSIEKSFIDEISREGNSSEITELNRIIKEFQAKENPISKIPESIRNSTDKNNIKNQTITKGGGGNSSTINVDNDRNKGDEPVRNVLPITDEEIKNSAKKAYNYLTDWWNNLTGKKTEEKVVSPPLAVARENPNDLLKPGGTLNLSYLPRRDLNNRSIEEFPKEFLVSQEKLNSSEVTDNGKIYHGAPTMEIALQKIPTEGFLENPATSDTHGKGAYATPSFGLAAGIYTQGAGLVLPLKLKQDPNIRILDFRAYESTEHYNNALNAAKSAGVDFFDYLAERYGIDVIITVNLVLKNAAVIDIPKGLLEIATRYAEDFNKTSDLSDRIDKYNALRKILGLASSEIGEAIRTQINFAAIEESLVAETSGKSLESLGYKRMLRPLLTVQENPVGKVSENEVPDEKTQEKNNKLNEKTGKSGTLGAIGSAPFLMGNSRMKNGEYSGLIPNFAKAVSQNRMGKVGLKLGRETFYIATAKAASDLIVQIFSSRDKNLKVSDYLAHLDEEYANMGLFSVGGGAVNTLIDHRLARLAQIRAVNQLYKINFADKMILSSRQQTMIKHQLGFFVGSLMIALKDAHKIPEMTVGELLSNVAVGQVEFMAVQTGLQATSVAVAELITNSRRLEKIKQLRSLARGLRAASVGEGVPGWILIAANFAITEGVVMPMMETFAQKSQIIERLSNLDGVMDEVESYLLEKPYSGKKSCKDEECYQALVMNAIKVNQDMNYFGMQKIFGAINVKQSEMEIEFESHNATSEKEIKDRADPEYKIKTMDYAKDFTREAKVYIQDYLKEPNDPNIAQAIGTFDHVLECMDKAKKTEVVKEPVQQTGIETYHVDTCAITEAQIIEAEKKLAVEYETMTQHQATPTINFGGGGLGDLGYQTGKYLGTNTSKAKVQQKMASVYARLGKMPINSKSDDRLRLRNTLMTDVYFLMQDSVKNNVKPVEEFLLDLQAAQIQPRVRMGKGTYKQRVYVTISEQDNLANAMDDLYLQYAYVNKCKNITTADQWIKTVFTKEDQERIRFAKEKLTKSRQAATQAAQPIASTELQYQWSGGAPTQTYKNLKPIEPLLPHETYKEDPKDLDQYPWITLAKIQTLKTDVIDKDGKSTQASIIRMDGQPLVQLLQTDKMNPTTLDLYKSYITCQ